MRRDELRRLIVGAIATVPTPFDDRFDVDYGRMAEGTERWIEAGLVTGKAVIKVAAAMGEGPQLGDDEWPALLRTVVQASRGRVPVIGAIHHKDTVRSIRHAREAQELGAIALQVNPPLFNDPSQDDILRYFEALSSAVDSGIVIYNNPWMPHGDIEVDTFRRMAGFEQVAVIKWEPLNRKDFEGIFVLADTFNIIDNTIELSRGRELGSRGFTSIGAGAYPPHYVRIWDLLESGDLAQAQAQWDMVDKPLRRFYAKVTQKSGGQGRVTKAMSEIMGFPMGPPRPPSLPIEGEDLAELREMMAGWGWPVA